VYPILVRTREYRAERRAVRALMQAHDVQVLHTHGYRPDVLHGSVARKLGRVQVTTLHGFVGSTRRGRLYEWLQVRAAARASAAIAVSQPIVQRLEAAGARNNVQLLRNAITPCSNAFPREDARRALSLPPEAKLVGWIGRVSEEKGPELFVEAIAASGAAVHGVMVGDGPLLEASRARAVALGIADRVHFVGLVPRASRYLAAFDALALTSRTEGTPMVLLEAMWAAVPIVTTAVGGVPDILSDQEAFLCPPSNATALGLAIRAVADDPPNAAMMAARARERVARQFGPEEWLAAHEALYRRLIAR
jgi:glycosyltransferase involved in cell wall biosynthesis